MAEILDDYARSFPLAVAVSPSTGAGFSLEAVGEMFTTGGWRTPQPGIGAGHALELGFVFNNPHSPDIAALTGPNPPHALATAMHRAWVDFAATGDPGWPRFTSDTRAIKLFDGGDNPVLSKGTKRRRPG